MEEINIRDFLSYLKHYIFALVTVVVFAVGVVAIYDTAFKKPVYQAQTTVVIAKSSDGMSDNAASLNEVNASLIVKSLKVNLY